MIRLLTALASLFLSPLLWLQAAFGKVTPEVARNRRGYPTAQVPDGPVIWVHAASLGELTAVRPVLRHLSGRYPRHHLLVTVNNPRALSVAEGWPDVRLIGQAAPADVPRMVRRFLRAWQPVAFINVEAELWPNRFAAIADARIPAIFLNARLSDKSLGMVKRFGTSAMHLDHFSHFFAQSAATTANLQALGLPAERIETTENLKALVELPEPHGPLARLLDRSDTILAASTHAPEEASVLQAFRRLRGDRPELTLILSPRHPRRAEEVAELVRRIGLTPLLLSRVSAQTDRDVVIVADGLGEQPALYGLAAVTFVGGSLPEDIGGHTPYEPIRAGSAIVTGPNVAKNAAEYAALVDGGGCVVAEDASGLAAALATALVDAAAISARADAALPTPADPEGLFARIAQKLELHP